MYFNTIQSAETVYVKVDSLTLIQFRKNAIRWTIDLVGFALWTSKIFIGDDDRLKRELEAFFSRSSLANINETMNTFFSRKQSGDKRNHKNREGFRRTAINHLFYVCAL